AISVTNTATGGGITTAGITTTGGTKGHGGSVTLDALGAVSTGAAGNINTAGGTTITGNAGRNAGAVTISGESFSSGTGTITASGTAGIGTNQAGGAGGAVSITTTAALNTAAITASSGNATGTGAGGAAGSISLSGGDVAVGNLVTTGGTRGNGGAVNVTSTGTMALAAVTASAGAGGTTAGNVTLTSSGAVTQSGAITAAGLALKGTGGSHVLRNAGNAVTTLAADTASIDYAQTGALTVGSVGGVTGVTATGSASIETTGAASSLTLANAVTAAGTGDAIVLKAGSSNAAGVASGGQIINSVGAGGIVAANGRFLAYSGDPSTTTEGTTGYSKRYNTAAGFTPAGTASHFLYRIAPTLTVTANNKSRVYGDANPVLDGTVTGLIDGDTASGVGATYSTTAVANTAVAAGPVVITAAATNNENYSVTLNHGALTITPRALTVSATGQNRVYDGTTNASVTLTDNRLGGDSLTLGNTAATFADKNVGTAKAVSVTGISVTGAAAANYTFNTTAATTADITARALTVGATGQSRVYDGTTNASVTLTDNRVAGDVLALSNTGASFADKNVGTAKAVNVTGINVTGTDAGNYTFNTTAVATADITARALTVGATGQNRVYDGTTGATVTLSDNRVAGDVLTLSNAGATFADKNVGTAKPVSVTGISVTGTDAGNYSFNTTAVTTANITARALTITATGQNRVYDGTTHAGVTFSDNRVAGDTLSIASTASFADKNVGTAKAISVTGITLGGADAGNYTFNTTAATAADITARALTVSATGQNRVYDGTTSASVTLGDNRVAGDALDLSHAAASFASKNAGTARTINVTGINVTGTDAGNYTFNTTAVATADITARALTVAATGQNRVYDGTTSATVTLS
ncbi:MAG: beta strand repeat-containing protein, partial [Ramlibacter sp.]